MDGSLAHPDRDMGMSSIIARVQPEECTILDPPHRSIRRIMALLVRYEEEKADGWYCPRAMAQDALSPGELDMVCGYMSSFMHLGVPSRGPPPSPGGKTPRSVRDASRRTSSWRLCWSSRPTRTDQPSPIRQRSWTCAGPRDPTINHSPQPTVAKIFETES